MQKKYVGMPAAFFVEQIQPISLFSFRWHPFAIDSSIDYSSEPMTLVTFTLEPAQGGMMLKVVEPDSMQFRLRAAPMHLRQTKRVGP